MALDPVAEPTLEEPPLAICLSHQGQHSNGQYFERLHQSIGVG